MRMLTNILCAASVLTGLASHVRAADWQPAQGPLATRWTKEVTPANAWREYPRPQLVRKEWTNLNGLWQYAITDAAAERPTTYAGEILVPFAVESALSGVMKPVTPQQRLWYQRPFDAPALEDGQRLLLHFGAVDWQCAVWVNGRQVGEHVGGYDPFTIDITSAVKMGTNELVVAVRDPTDTGYQPKGKQVLDPQGIMYTAVTGIWQTVWLEVVPRDFIESLKIVPDVDRQELTVTVRAAAPLAVALKALDAGNVCATASGQAGQPIALKISHAKLWSPDSPHLYDLQVELLANGHVVDRVESYFGMRKIEVRRDAEGVNRLMLNNRVLFQYGPLDQGWWPDGLYTPPTDEAIQYDIAMTKKFGMNMARKHVKYESARWYYWCDRLGLLVWQDMPSGEAQRSAESKANYRRELQAMVDALHNAPSIVMWVPFNEGWGQHDTADVVRWMEQYDPTRPINEASGWTDQGSGTVSDMHSYPGPGMRAVEDQRVAVLGEFGGLGMPVPGHTWQAKENWGYVSFENAQLLTDAYVDLLTRMRPLIGQGLSAAVYTQTTDVEIEVNGLMTYDREVNKVDVERAAEAARKLYLPPPIVQTLVPTSQVAPQSWRFTFQQPADDWFQPGFVDADWQTGPGGFGTSGTPGAIVGTTWDSADIWLRRTFILDTIPVAGEVSLTIHHDEDADVYLNGQCIARLGGFSTSYATVPLSDEAKKAFQPGVNTIAIHCHQSQGGQYIDAGVSILVEPWIPLFDGVSLAGWRAAEHAETWRVEQGALVAQGPRSHLFYAGPVGNSDFRNFELVAEFKTGNQANSGIYFHTEYQESGWPDKGYEVQINNTYPGEGEYRELKKTGSLYAIRNIYHSGTTDESWTALRVRVVGQRIRVWVNEILTVDYVQPENPQRTAEWAGKKLSHGTLALQAHDPGSAVAFRTLQIRLLPDDADPELPNRPSDAGYGTDPDFMDQLSCRSIPFLDLHIHIRGGLTPAKVADRQAVTGIGAGVLRNIGQGWEIETDEQLREFLDSVAGMPLLVGLQVNDRDWTHRHAPELIQRLDYVLADTMIMPMPTDDGPPVKLWLADQYQIDDPEAWMQRYVRHNLRVLAEPITVLANPTYLPAAVAGRYDQLWTDERMRLVIQAALDNQVALEINAASPWPHDRFIRMAKSMGAKFTFGSNNFDDKPINMQRCLEAIARYGLTAEDLYVPRRITDRE